jgi:hypothetical protein
MYNNQYGRKIIWVTGIAIKSQNRLFVHEYLMHFVHFYTSNKNLLRANFWSDPIIARIDKISTKMCYSGSKITQLVSKILKLMI